MAFNFSFTQSFSFSGGGGGGGGYDTDAQAYITAVETADSASLETGVKDAINAFVVYCKAQGIWTAINASCILAGARTLSGALVPLKGTAPTNVNFVSGDYDRKTGLLGNGTTKYIDSNRAGTADAQDSHHVSVFGATPSSTLSSFIGAGTLGDAGATSIFSDTRLRNRSSSIDGSILTRTASFIGSSRSTSSDFTGRSNGANTVYTRTSEGRMSTNYFVFARNTGSIPNILSAERIAFYSIGASVDLANLETAITNLMTAISTAF